MDFSNYVVTTFIFLTFLSISYGQSSDRPVIVIDPGHGGTDAGAIGVNRVLEKDIVLSVAKKMDSLNTHLFDDRFDMYLTRYQDTLISLGNRTQLAMRLHADVFISLHCNQTKNKKAKGIEVYVDEKRKRYSKSSFGLANNIQRELNDMIGFKSRGVKGANFQVLRETTNHGPAVLLELGFLSSNDEAKHLTKEENHNGIALAILESISKIR
ncbi:N-acetylmuramoyl-L-alanine amidase [Maribacter polysiphoniae]|uniref:N-acetylmuramoyl-L-alanine amidase n=1 Tax=Maribacter polysiphoniae TaxID=429344 RepID=A0A316DTT2_9FLAO|nr:N-acetylmuramoyl-L-alanine amidase [Maribacter polysiphoniae]MBD1262018.1 N-acetylmuramoyl-L-alanine amidase [Maribacter polysiphoniae]PWK21707.1 N-acetylmuramoyl-L-alanine amidase [Maribacter polysiphoniae]